MRQTDNFLSMLCIVGGAILIIIGISPLIIPALLVILGFMLINYGLALRHLPPLTVLTRRWFFSRLRFK